MTSVGTIGPLPTPTPNPDAAGHVRSVMPERAALGDLYDRYGCTAYSLALSITNDRAAAERIVTSAFATTWRDAARESASVSAAPFFAALIATVRLRALATRRTTTPPASFIPAPFSEKSTVGLLVVDALGTLPEPQRQVLALAYFGGLGVADIASELRQPVGNVTGNLHAALGSLRLALAEQPRGAIAQ